MNSKEALEKLNFECIRSNGVDDEYAKELKIVQKDLEVLDILKKNIFVSDNMIYATPNELEKDDYNKLKEWIGNNEGNSKENNK